MINGLFKDGMTTPEHAERGLVAKCPSKASMRRRNRRTKRRRTRHLLQPQLLFACTSLMVAIVVFWQQHSLHLDRQCIACWTSYDAEPLSALTNHDAGGLAFFDTVPVPSSPRCKHWLLSSYQASQYLAMCQSKFRLVVITAGRAHDHETFYHMHQIQIVIERVRNTVATTR